jgi:hypothetical protein
VRSDALPVGQLLDGGPPQVVRAGGGSAPQQRPRLSLVGAEEDLRGPALVAGDAQLAGDQGVEEVKLGDLPRGGADLVELVAQRLALHRGAGGRSRGPVRRRE